MRIIKKFPNSISTENLNHSIENLPCYGVRVQAKYDTEGILTIKGIEAEQFAKQLANSRLTINVHLFSQKYFEKWDYQMIASALSEVNDKATIILSSSHLTRTSLNQIREEEQEYRTGITAPKMYIAATDDITALNSETGDLVYSPGGKMPSEYQYNRLTSYAKNGIPVLLDWETNEQQRIRRMIESTDNSKDLIVLSKKPQTARRILDKTMRIYK